MKLKSFQPGSADRRSRGFSLVEVAISLGIVSFGLVGVLGALPLAFSSAQESIAQTRASEVANSLFASFRTQPFSAVGYVDAQFANDGVTPSGAGPSTIDLRSALTPAGINDAASPPNVDNQYIRFYASIVQTDTNVSANDPARIHFTVQPPVDGGFQVILHFNNFSINDSPGPLPGAGLANRVEMLISPMDHPRNYYRFSSVVVNRDGNLNLSQL